MTFDARAQLANAQAEYTPFEFIDLDGETQELPNPYVMLPADLRDSLGIGPDDDLERFQQRDILAAVAGDAWAKVRDMPMITQKALLEAWSAHCGLEDDEEGKEPSDSSEPDPEGELSKPTSPSEDRTSGEPRSGG